MHNGRLKDPIYKRGKVVNVVVSPKLNNFDEGKHPLLSLAYCSSANDTIQQKLFAICHSFISSNNLITQALDK